MNTDYWTIAVVLLFIFFWGDPDIADGIVHWLMN